MMASAKWPRGVQAQEVQLSRCMSGKSAHSAVACGEWLTWERADNACASSPAASQPFPAKFHAMEPSWQLPPDARPGPEHLSSEARGLFAAGWYATRDEGRLVHPVEQTELLVSSETWLALRELGASTPVTQAPPEPA